MPLERRAAALSLVLLLAVLRPASAQTRGAATAGGVRLRGAIVEAPEGLVFFKLTGPAATIRAAERGFEALVASFSRSAPAGS